MNGQVQTVTEIGMEGHLVEVECHLSNGLPGIIMVGLPNRSTEEAKDRIRSAFASCKLPMPRKRITINLAPADIPKEGTGFDLAIATAILLADARQNTAALEQAACFGELALDGSLRPVRGLVGKLLGARKLGLRSAYVPTGNLSQALLVPGLQIYAVSHLEAFYRHLIGEQPLTPSMTKNKDTVTAPPDCLDFSEIVGQARAKRALEIAAAGHHNVLLNGPPGTGKSMLAKALAGIMPPLSTLEMLEVTHLHSLAAKNLGAVIRSRPLRAPHHTASDTALLGGGQHPKPGEISLSHKGVLFLDEFPEFSRRSIEALRQPLEDKHITVARARETVHFPADFILVATRNPCPCGYFGSDKPCICAMHEIYKYEKRLSGPILDRIDLHVTVDSIDHEKLLSLSSGIPVSAEIAASVKRARARQSQRYNADTTNASMTNQEIKTFAKLEDGAKELLNRAAEQLKFSARAYMRCIRVARTIADLAESEAVAREHIAEAIQYRRPALQLHQQTPKAT